MPHKFSELAKISLDLVGASSRAICHDRKSVSWHNRKVNSGRHSLYLNIGFSDRRGTVEHHNKTPYVMAAFFCDRVLRESDSVLSAIRIVDIMKFAVPPTGLPENTKPLILTTLFLGVKSGRLKGEFSLKVRGVNPKGDVKEVSSIPLTLGGENVGQNYILTLSIGVEVEGLHWFEVLFEDEIITAIPLTIESYVPDQGTPMEQRTPD